MSHNLIASLPCVPRIRRVCPHKIRLCAAVALAVTLALGGSHLAAQALLDEEVAAPSAVQTESATTNATGTGTINHLARWTGSTALGDSIITQLNGKIGIAAPNPTSKLTVIGTDTKAATVRGVNSSTGSAIAAVSTSGNAIVANTTGGSGLDATVTGKNAYRPAVVGRTNSTADGADAIEGQVTSSSAGKDSAGVRGWNNGQDETASGVYGYGSSIGVRGSANTGVSAFGYKIGVAAASVEGPGVQASSDSNAGVAGTSNSSTGVSGTSTSGAGVTGQSTNWYGVYGTSANSYAGYFEGPVRVTGTLTKPAGSFQIDDPLDPANKYLSHSFVESPDMMNIYNGNITTDAEGYATVQMPHYFSALNRDFRYQLTVVGQFAQAIVAEKIKDNDFRIRTDKPEVEVSWQVTGIRHDAYAEAHRIQVEVAKTGSERGRYLFPAGFGRPETEAIGNPQLAAAGRQAANPKGD